MATDPAGGGRDSSAVYVTETPKFDLESYISNYEGPTRLSRFGFIGRHSLVLGPEALHLGITEAQASKNIRAYLALAEDLARTTHTDTLEIADKTWTERTENAVRNETERLENELRGYKNNLIKESIRMGNQEVGSHYFSIGDNANAFKSYSRMKEYCTTPRHVAEMSLKLILVSIAQNNWLSVQSNVYKIQNLSLKPEEKSKIDPILPPLSGLASMQQGLYREAALHFINTDPSFSTVEPVADIKINTQVMTSNDVAIYGGLCALASLTRQELQTQVLENTNFRTFLELESHIRRAINNFCNSKYTNCLSILDNYKPDYLLDLHLQRHIQPLYNEIRRKSIVNYFTPFSHVTLSSLASAFSVPNEETLENELAEMIKQGRLKARLDLVDRLLVATKEHKREMVHFKTLNMVDKHEKALRLRLFRLAMLEAGLDIRGKGRPKGQGGQGAPGDGVRMG